MTRVDLIAFPTSAGLVTLATMVTLAAAPVTAQDGGWTHWGGNAASTRYSAHDQIDAGNFEDLEVAWVWRGDNFGPHVYNLMRATPIYAQGTLFSVSGERRTVVAIDPATGETLWWIPNGDTPDRIANNPALEGVDIGNTGSPTHPTTIVTKTLLIYGEGRGGRAVLHAHNKTTGERIGTLEIPAPTNTAPMTYMHGGVQYIVAPIGGSGGGRGGRGGRQHPGSLVALRLP